MTFSTDLLDPLYEDDFMAVDATIETASGTQIAVRAIDKSKGTTVGGGGGGILDLQTLTPVAFIRMSELAGVDVNQEINGGQITLNGRTWRVKNHEFKPMPDAPVDRGEIMLMLTYEGEAI